MAQDTPCSACGATVIEEKIAYSHTIEGTDYIVEGVLAKACPGCGEQSFSPETITAIHELIEQNKVGS
jgi:YgiT-type zinc finger domain-containing protein